MFEFEDNLCEQYGIHSNKDFEKSQRFGFDLLDTQTHLWNAAMHLYFEWSQTGSETNHHAAKEMLDRIRSLMIASAISKKERENLKNDKMWYGALMQGDEIE